MKLLTDLFLSLVVCPLLGLAFVGAFWLLYTLTH